MAVLKTYIKQPGDRLDYDFDYSAWLNPDDEIISAEFAVEFLGSPVPAVIMTDDATVMQPTFTKIWLVGGAAGEVYKVSCTVTTTRGRIKQDEIKIRVKEY